MPYYKFTNDINTFKILLPVVFKKIFAHFGILNEVSLIFNSKETTFNKNKTDIKELFYLQLSCVCVCVRGCQFCIVSVLYNPLSLFLVTTNIFFSHTIILTWIQKLYLQLIGTPTQNRSTSKPNLAETWKER